MSESTMSPADISAMMNNGGGNAAMWNNPWIYMVWMMMLKNGFGNNGDAAASQSVETNAKLNSLSQQIQDNQNTNMLNSGVQSNHDYLHDFQNAVNLGFAGTNAAINNDTQSGIIGNKDLQSTIQTSACGINSSILNQTNQLQSRIDQLSNGTQTGFASIGYQIAQQTNDLNTNLSAQVQSIKDMMCQNTQQELRDKILALSQEAQTASIVGQLKTCNCGN